MRLSRICLMQRFLHIAERLAALWRGPGWGAGGRGGSRDAPGHATLGAWVLGHNAAGS